METRLCPPDDPGFRLIETCAWVPGQGVALRAWHRARLQDAARRLAIPLRDDVALLLDQISSDTPLRVRVTVDVSGQVRLETSAFDPTPPSFWRIGLSGERLDEHDPWRGVKSTERGVYDRARAALPEGLDEVVLINTAGFVADGSITTLFADFGQGLVTPPRRDGVLPGVLRASLIEQGRAREARLSLADVQAADQLWVGNALRGLIPARWQGCEA